VKKILTIVGARPQFIKCAALSPVLRKEFKEVIVHTGQHYDYQMSHSFFDELAIPEPEYNLQVGSASACVQIAQILIKLDEVLANEKPDLIIVFGDTNSTAAGAIAAAKHQIKLAHVEAGLREFNKAIPEESNKLITDALSDYYFCPTDYGVEILHNAGVTDHVYNIGDVMIDLNYRYQDFISSNTAILEKYNLKPKDFYLLTCHRASNTDDPKRLKSILEAINDLDKKVVFPIHPRTKKVVEQENLGYLLENDRIIVTEPLKYLDTQTLVMHASFALTDSGGITKEAYFYKTPGIILDTQTEWMETVNEGWNQIIGPDRVSIVNAIKNWKKPTVHTNCIGDGHASEKITQILKNSL
jgi:UDP-N-acetylglucosamine 2-epimerase